MAEHLYQRRRERGEDVAFEQVKRDLLERPDRAANILAPVEEQCAWLRDLAPGLTPRSVLDKFRAVQMLDITLPTTDGRKVILSRYTQPEKELQILLNQLKLELPEQPPPKITATGELAN